MTLETILLLIIIVQLGGILFRVGRIRDNTPEIGDGYQPKGPRLREGNTKSTVKSDVPPKRPLPPPPPQSIKTTIPGMRPIKPIRYITHKSMFDSVRTKRRIKPGTMHKEVII